MDETSSPPFDDYPEPGQTGETCKRTVHLLRLRALLRLVSAITFGLAGTSACIVVVLDALHFFQPQVLPLRIKSAFPLMFVGLSYGCLQFTIPRTWKELALGLAVGSAFVLWGVEQFIGPPAVVALIDDLVMFLFVMDLSIVIRGRLKG